MPADSQTTIGMAAALLALDAEGGWDHENTGGWPSMGLWRDLKAARDAGYVEESSAYGVQCWRLTDEGILFRKEIEANAE